MLQKTGLWALLVEKLSYILQSSVATRLRCGGIFNQFLPSSKIGTVTKGFDSPGWLTDHFWVNDDVIVNLLLSPN